MVRFSCLLRGESIVFRLYSQQRAEANFEFPSFVINCETILTPNAFIFYSQTRHLIYDSYPQKSLAISGFLGNREINM